jgi:ABC-2 type transport system permease protein
MCSFQYTRASLEDLVSLASIGRSIPIVNKNCQGAKEGEQVQATDFYDSGNRNSPSSEEFMALVRYRDLIPQLIARGIKIRYKRSVLGISWTMLNPLLMMVVLALVFSSIFKFYIENFAAYLLTGLLLWNFFSQSTTAAMTEMVYGGILFRQIYMPKSVFAVSSLGIGLVNLAFSLIPLFLIMLVLGVPIRLTALFIPVPILLTALFTLGVSLLLSAGVVYFADLVPIYEVILTTWMYLTPIIYPLDIVPDQLVWMIRLNPIYYLVESFRKPIFEGVLPSGKIVLVACACALGCLALGWWVFCQRSDEYAYRI